MEKLLCNKDIFEGKTKEDCIKKLISSTDTTVSDWFFVIKPNRLMYATPLHTVTSITHKAKSKENTDSNIFVLDYNEGEVSLSIKKKRGRGRPKKEK